MSKKKTPAQSPDDLLTLAQVAEIIGLTRPGAWERVVKQQAVPAQKLGQQWFVRRADAERLRGTKSNGGRPRKNNSDNNKNNS